jgi:uncharacterized PurR-regulated membrane protein YhhQ (DUF165 family)
MKDIMTPKSLMVILSLVTMYVVVTLISNLSSLRIIHLIGFSMDAGSLLYPITFTLRI